MTFRLPVNISKPVWRDGQQVVEADMDDEQNHNAQADAAFANNFFGSGLLLENPNINVLFDSDNLTSAQQQYIVTNDFDGRGISPIAQPTDSIFGNQLEINLTNANVSLRMGVKLCIIGTDFQNAIQYELFTLNANEIQVSKKHFKTVISILFNDFRGNKNGSRNLYGSLLIREVSSMQLSRDELSAYQTEEPNLFFRDFKCYDNTLGPNPTMILFDTIQLALGTSGYVVDALNISAGYREKKSLPVNDLLTRYGQKFKAKVNNIQKVRLLLGVEGDFTQPTANWYDWSGDLIINIHALQTTVACPTDIIPDNTINYDPFPSPIVQIVITQATLLATGITLTDIAQPVDFIFANTRVGGFINTGITKDNYYVVTVQRAGSTVTGEIFTLTGADLTADSIFTEFNGTNWVDDENSDLWFEIYSDSLKVSDGAGYDEGTGISIEKTIIDVNTGTTIDYSEEGIPFANNGFGTVNYTVVQAINELITPIQDSRTGNSVFSRQHSSAEISTITSAQLASLKTSADPIVLGCSYDINNKNSLFILGYQNVIGMTSGNEFCIINPDPQIISSNLIGSTFIPNINNPNSESYLIYKVNTCTDGYGDLNGDGYVGADDIAKITSMIGEDITTVATQSKILAGTPFTAVEFLRADINGDGVINITDLNFALSIYNKDITIPLPFGDTFTKICIYVENLYGRNDGYFSSYDGWARIWDTSVPTQGQYNVEPRLLAGSAYLPYYGYPVPVDVPGNEPALLVVPFVPVQFGISLNPVWMKELIKTSYTGRLIPCSFVDTSETSAIIECVEPTKTYCESTDLVIPCGGGTNSFFIPDDLIMGNGQMKLRDGNFFPIDMEVATITLKLPDLPINNKALDIFSLFIAESVAHTGFTTASYHAVKFADCTFVQTDALAKNQVRFAISLESLSITLDGYDTDIGFDAYGVIADPLIGTFIDHETGVLTIRGTNINSDPDITLNCKILITVYLKKAGWKNLHTEVSPNELISLLGL